MEARDEIDATGLWDNWRRDNEFAEADGPIELIDLPPLIGESYVVAWNRDCATDPDDQDYDEDGNLRPGVDN